ncbi:MAG: peptidylprolyl isomerase [Pseudomonadota bacterium]
MNFKHLLLVLLLPLLTLATAGARAETQVLDQVVAIVDDDIIMASELRNRLDTVTATLQSREIEMPPEDVLIRETLDRLILESIQMQLGARVGVRISDAQLNGAMGRIASQNGLTLDQFRVAMEQQGQSYIAAREQIRREMVIQRVQSGNVNQRIQITEQEVENFLATDEGKKMSQPEYRILHALLELPSGISRDEEAAAAAYVDGLVRRIRAGEPFDQVIGSSTGRYTFTGGDLGWRSRDDLPSLFAEVAPQLGQGETSDPIRSASGLHVIYMGAVRGGEQMVSQTKVRHILVKPSEIMSDNQARDLVANLKVRAKDGEDFGDLAREYSEDIGSAQEGGELGWTQPGQMVPEFEQAMNATPVGEISDPVRSQFGWHVLEVEGRRDQDVTDQAIKNKASEYLHSRKYQEELDAWLRKIRDEAFVDIK